MKKQIQNQQTMAAKEETVAEVLAEVMDAYMTECVKHFIGTRSRSMADDARYFYTKEELWTFKEKFTKEGGDLDTLHIGIVYTDNHDFLCYEVCRNSYYNLETAHSRKVIGNSVGGKNKIFYS